MRVRLTWVDRDLRGNELARREEVLQGESGKNPTRNYVAKLIARFHPELISVDRVHLVDDSEGAFRWYVKSERIDSNCWVTAYADPTEDGPTQF